MPTSVVWPRWSGARYPKTVTLGIFLSDPQDLFHRGHAGTGPRPAVRPQHHHALLDSVAAELAGRHLPHDEAPPLFGEPDQLLTPLPPPQPAPPPFLPPLPPHHP